MPHFFKHPLVFFQFNFCKPAFGPISHWIINIWKFAERLFLASKNYKLLTKLLFTNF